MRHGGGANQPTIEQERNAIGLLKPSYDKTGDVGLIGSLNRTRRLDRRMCRSGSYTGHRDVPGGI